MILDKTLKSLEFNKVIETVSTYAVLSTSKEFLREEKPKTDYSEVKFILDKTREAYNLYINGVKGVIYFDEITEELERSKKNATLSPKELLNVARLLRSSRITASEIIEFAEENSILRDIANRIFYDNYLENEIFSKIVNEDEVSDNASEKLYQLRKNIKRINERIRERLQSYMRAGANKYLQDNVVSIRGGRYVVPVKSECVGAVKGFIHDRSQSGSTFFVEPQEILDLNNELKSEMLAEIAEIERILADLTVKVSVIADNLYENIVYLTDIDVAFAKAEYSYKIKAVLPELNANGVVDIVKGRHPLIDKDKVIPVSISFGAENNYMLISGPNTGGKTVTLKLVGLLTLMAMTGIYVPAVEGTKISVFESIFANIGDEQSIENSLSTFSSHVSNLIETLGGANEKSLVLIDEIGAGTDPEEGSALAQAIIEKLLALNSYGVITTHYSQLKEFAFVTDKIINASMDFDVMSFAPLYKLNVGMPGSSNAIEISRRIGLSSELLARAKELLSSDKIALDKVIFEAEKSKSVADGLRLELEEMKQKEVEIYNSLIQERKKFDKERENFLLKSKLEARKIVNEKLEDAEEMLAEMKEIFKKQEYSQADLVKMATLKNKLENEKYNLDKNQVVSTPYKPVEFATLKQGDTVYVKSLDDTGTVLDVNVNKGNAWVLVGSLRVNLKKGDIFFVSKSENKPSQAKVSIKRDINPNVSLTEINVIGLNLDEALDKVEKFLDSAVLSNLEEVKIVHGKGLKILSSGIQSMLRKHKHVDSFRFGKYGEGEHGVTIVKLK